MIQLREDLIFVKRSNGHIASIGLEDLAHRITTHPTIGTIELWVARQIAHAVLHYFRMDQQLELVEESELERVLKLVLERCSEVIDRDEPSPFFVTDLRKIAVESGYGCELVFFRKLESTLTLLREHRAQVIQFTGLRSCVKLLSGTKHWTHSCRLLENNIVTFLQHKAQRERGCRQSLLVVS